MPFEWFRGRKPPNMPFVHFKTHDRDVDAPHGHVPITLPAPAAPGIAPRTGLELPAHPPWSTPKGCGSAASVRSAQSLALGASRGASPSRVPQSTRNALLEGLMSLWRSSKRRGASASHEPPPLWARSLSASHQDPREEAQV